MSNITLKIGGVEFKEFNAFKIALNYNGIASTFSFDARYDQSNKNHRNLFKPLQYQDCQVLFDGNVILTGIILNHQLTANPEPTLNNISGYSKTGILEDSILPPDQMPTQFDNLNLKEIAESLIKPFGLKLIIDQVIQDINTLYPDKEITSKGESATSDDEKENYDTISKKEHETIKEFLTKLCQQKNIILTHNAYGDLVFTRVKSTKQSIATFTENRPSTRIALSVDGQKLHSQITPQGQMLFDTNQEQTDTIFNSLIKEFRPTVVTQSVGAIKKYNKANIYSDSFGIQQRSAELRSITLTIDTNEWIWFDGRRNHMIKPNDIIDVISPQIFLSKRTSFFVESVELMSDEKSATANIKCVLPHVYNGQDPVNIFS